MRIVFSSSFDSGVRSLTEAADRLAKAQDEVSSGRRLTRLSDDPIGTETAISDHATLDRLAAYGSASDAAAYRLGLADNVLTDVVNQLQSAQTTALSARGTSATQQQRDAAANELIAIRDALMGDISTKFQGAYLFSGSNITVAPFATTGSGISGYQGDAAPTTIEIGPGRVVANTFNGGAIFQGLDSAHVLDALTTLAADVSAGNTAGIAAGVDALSRAFDRATTAQSAVGTDLRSIDDGRALNSAGQIAAKTRISAVEDADIAEAASRLSQAETAYRAALSSIATIGQVSLLDYLK